MRVSALIKKVHRGSGIRFPLTTERARALTYNLRIAGIEGTVPEHDLQLAAAILRDAYRRVGGFRDDEKYKNLKPNDVLRVFHGTPLFRLPLLINGFDATQIKSRDYNSPRHRGLFVTLDLEMAKSFGGGAVLEIAVRAKNLHGTDYGGNIGRKQKNTEGAPSNQWMEDKYPNSFRPYLSYTMLSSTEPQALLVGLVSPKQIKRVWVREGDVWKESTRKDLFDSGLVYKKERRGKDYVEQKVEEAGVDLSSPKLGLDEFSNAFGKAHGKSSESVKESLLRFYRAGEDRLQNLLMYNIKFGGSHLGPLAVKSLVRQIAELAEETTSYF